MALPQESTQSTAPSGDTSGKNKNNGTIRIVPYADLDHATVFPHIAKIKYQCFGVGKPFLGCFSMSERDLSKHHYTLYGADGKNKYPEAKLMMMGVAVSETNDGPTKYLGFIQITFSDLPADMDLPLEFMRHECKKNECYVEQVGVDSDARGMGVGSLLMNWAEEQATKKFGQTPQSDPGFLSLEVVRCNKGAIRVYERLGYKIVHRGCFGEMMTSCMTIPVIGHRGTHKMVKDLSAE